MAISHGFAGLAFPCMIAAAIFSAVGFATDNWARLSSKFGSVGTGLWTACGIADPYSAEEGWFKATQAMMTIGLILLVCSLILLFLYLFVQSLNSKGVMTAFTALAFAADVYGLLFVVLFMVIGQIIYRVKMDKYNGIGFKMHWSYGMSVTGAILCLVSAILAVVHLKQPESSYSNLG